MFKSLLMALLLLAALYLLAAFALYGLQRKFIFHPSPPVEHAFAEVLLPLAGSSGQLKLIVANPGRQHALIYFGGNAESVAANAAELAREFADHTLYLVNYRGYGGSSGSASQDALFADATLVFDYVSSEHRRVSAIGRSLGSGVVCWLATQRSPDAIVLVTPFDSIQRIAQRQFPMFPVGLLLKDPFASHRYAAQIDQPVLVLQARDDRVIPAASTQRLIAAFATPVQSAVLDGSGHNDIQLNDQYYPLIRDFLAQLEP